MRRSFYMGFTPFNHTGRPETVELVYRNLPDIADIVLHTFTPAPPPRSR